MKYANLHLHSSMSDGGYRPTHLAKLARSMGYKALAITDHDVLNGIPELFAAAKALELEAISGVELCGNLEDRASFHIVGLDFDYQNKTIIEYSEHMTSLRNAYTRRQFEYAVERGILTGITWEDVIRLNPESRWYCNDQVALALDRMGLVPFAESDSVRAAAFFAPEARAIAKDIMKEMCPPVSEVISVIHAAGGLAILAHPTGHTHTFVEELVCLGLDGIEVSHPDLFEDEVKRAYHAAIQYKLYCSGGTDHSGIMSACSGMARGGKLDLSVETYSGASEEEFKAIKERKPF